MKGDDNPADLFTKHLNREKMHRALQFMSCEFREGRSPIAPQRKEYENILGENMEWQIADAVREEFDDDEVELRLAKESVYGELQGMEEVHAASESCDDASGRGRRESECELRLTNGCAGRRCDYGGRTTDDVTMVAAWIRLSTATIQNPISQSK